MIRCIKACAHGMVFNMTGACFNSDAALHASNRTQPETLVPAHNNELHTQAAREQAHAFVDGAMITTRLSAADASGGAFDGAHCACLRLHILSCNDVHAVAAHDAMCASMCLKLKCATVQGV